MATQREVAEGRRLIRQGEEVQWRFAELTHQVVTRGTGVRQWARELTTEHKKVQPDHVSRCRRVWERWGVVSIQQRPPFWNAYNAVSQGEDDPDVAAEKVDQRRVRHSLGKLSAPKRAEIAGELLDDPDVQQELIAPGKPRPAPQRDRDPVGGGGGGQRGIIGKKQDVFAWMLLQTAIGEAGRALKKGLREWDKGDLGPEAIDHLNEMMDEHDRLSQAFRQAFNAQLDEAELAAFLGGGE